MVLWIRIWFVDDFCYMFPRISLSTLLLNYIYYILRVLLRTRNPSIRASRGRIDTPGDMNRLAGDIPIFHLTPRNQYRVKLRFIWGFWFRLGFIIPIAVYCWPMDDWGWSACIQQNQYCLYIVNSIFSSYSFFCFVLFSYTAVLTIIISIPLNFVCLGSFFVLFHPLHDWLNYDWAIVVETYVTVFSEIHFTPDSVEIRRFAMICANQSHMCGC